ncbi:hypothetical protein [Bdellovibrio bacteriovorus]|uniref:Peptidase C39-like domain-containing protein n=1 Tax=Bdellovibrio bacteriovorus str. Tiberius TaxID=1069642 RepID=K7YS23_BDEBC|nr:hypothetical protein [Bdellovibrio bacteriovorus]AFY00403.1 hypothetical protein Bdt_0696 [Bdellovibrio bacteriovorus str. Tiberius]
MRISILFVLLLSFNPAFAGLELPHESQLASLMLNQNDDELYLRGVIPHSRPSSLCGPASAINWLQLENKSLSKSQQVDLLAQAASVSLAQGTDVNQGLIEPQLVQYLKNLDQLTGRNNHYGGKGRHFGATELTVSDLLSSEPQILLLRYDSRPRPAQPPIGRGRSPRIGGDRDGGRDMGIPILDENEIRGFHFVLKVAADSASQEILFIDPENPGRYSRARLEIRNNPRNQKPEVRVLPHSAKDLVSFSGGGMLIWTALSAIEKNP